MNCTIISSPPSAGRLDGPFRDRRVGALETLVDSGDYDLLSLDVFDTLVWRMVPAPVDVFFLVARELAQRGALYESSSLESFVSERIDAERRARRAVPGHEVTLDAIYAAFPRGYLRTLAPREVAALEFEVEQRLVRPNPEMLALLDRARRRGMQTALVSDTYFTRRQVRALAGVSTDHTLVSCEHGVSKFMGLHRVLVERSRVAPARILHVGDNSASDVEGPAPIGIARYWLGRFPEAYEKLVDTELPVIYSHRAPFIAAPDAGLTALRGRMMFAAATEYERWGAGVLGPVVAGFCDWVAGRCRALGITSALCLMREGRVLKQVLDAQGSGLVSAEFFVSRYIALKAAIFDGSVDELSRFVLRPSPQRCGRILEQLGLEPSDLPGEDPAALLTSEATLDLIGRIAAAAALRRRVIAASAAARSHLLAHLATTLPAGGSRTVAVVDLGYKGTIQACLAKILERERLDVITHGLYLVTNGSVHESQAGGAAIEGWLASNGQPVSMADTFVRSPEIVEQSLMAACGTTLGHRADGEPILGADLVPAEQRRQIAEIQSGLLAWTGAWAAHRAGHGIVDTGVLEPFYRSICVRAIARPFDLELDLFADWEHDENFGSDRTRTLTGVTDMHDWERSHISAHQLASLPPARVYWPFGFARRLSPVLGEAVAHIFLRTAGPGVFDSAHEPRPVAFYWDAGAGFNPRDTSVEEVVLNSRGRVWHRFSLGLDRATHRMYGFTPARAGEVFCLTGIRLRLCPTQGAPRTVDFPHEAVLKDGCSHLHGNLYVAEQDPLVLAVPAEGVTGFTGTVEVDVFFGIVPGA